eukprot:Gb_19992 [translate_table: standard]
MVDQEGEEGGSSSGSGREYNKGGRVRNVVLKALCLIGGVLLIRRYTKSPSRWDHARIVAEALTGEKFSSEQAARDPMTYFNLRYYPCTVKGKTIGNEDDSLCNIQPIPANKGETFGSSVHSSVMVVQVLAPNRPAWMGIPFLRFYMKDGLNQNLVVLWSNLAISQANESMTDNTNNVGANSNLVARDFGHSQIALGY